MNKLEYYIARCEAAEKLIAKVFNLTADRGSFLWKEQRANWQQLVNTPIPQSDNQWPTDNEIHFIGTKKYNMNIVTDGELKQRIIQMANIYREGMRDMRDYLKQSSVKDVDWIPVGERCPEQSMCVLVTTSGGKVDEMWYSKDLGWHSLRDEEEVTHWMMMPKPAHDGFLTDDDIEKYGLCEG